MVGVDIEQYDKKNPAKYLRGLLRDEADPVSQRAFRSYLGVVASSPVVKENFTLAVNKYMERPPFNFPNPLTNLGGVKRVSMFCVIGILGHFSRPIGCPRKKLFCIIEYYVLFYF